MSKIKIVTSSPVHSARIAEPASKSEKTVIGSPYPHILET